MHLHPLIPGAAALFLACGTHDAPKQRTVPASGSLPVEFPIVDDNIRHDTLLIQTTFDMGDGTFLMVASNVDPEFEGIRLYRYELFADSNARILSYSNGAYDSWTMLPTFFSIPDPPGTYLVLANFGERESWGQKLLFMDSTFTDLGFLDVALPEHLTEGDSTYVKRTNAAPYGRLALHGDTAVFTFACDSLFLYDDMAGHNDLIVPAHLVRYAYHAETGLVLWYNGQPRAVKQPG